MVKLCKMPSKKKKEKDEKQGDTNAYKHLKSGCCYSRTAVLEQRAQFLRGWLKA